MLPEQKLTGLLPQGFRFGVEEPEALKAIDMAFELAPAPSSQVYKGAMKTLTLVGLLFVLISHNSFWAQEQYCFHRRCPMAP